MLNNIIKYSMNNNTSVYHIDLFDILTKSFELDSEYFEFYDNITIVSSDYGFHGMNMIKENLMHSLLYDKVKFETIIINPQLALDYNSLNHIGQKLVNMKLKDDLLRKIRDLQTAL